jgi:NADPH-ferrihemoprotein reductase
MLPVIIAAVVAVMFAYMFGFIGGNKKSGGGKPTTPTTPRTPRSSAASVAERDTHPVLVMFGSQTGTAEMYAKTLVREAQNVGVPAALQDVETYDHMNRLETERLVVFVVATYGEGEPTDAMKSFHDWLMDDMRQPDDLKHVRYAVFGLGDKQYKYFAHIGVEVDNRMAALGATRVYGLGTGDAGSNMEEEFDAWRQNLWAAVGHALSIELKKETEEPYVPELKMKVWEEAEAPLPFPKMASALEPTQRLPVYATVAENRDLLAASCTDRCTRHISLDIGDTLISYQAGDHLGVLPRNNETVVQQYLDILDVDATAAAQVFSLQDKNMKNVFPARVSVRTALTWYLDLSGVPKKSTLRAFAHYCTDAAEREDLLGSLRVTEVSQDRYKKLLGKLRTVHGFLRKYKSCKVPIAVFMELMPRMVPRYFSIASDQLAQPKHIFITMAVMEGGVCTTMLKNATLGDKFPVFVRKSTFHLPLRSKTRPLIMIGPGTGVAPLMGFLHRRTQWKAKGQEIGEAHLYFGCRKQDEDHIYKEAMYEALGSGVLTALRVAYSRDQSTKVYVQNLLKEDAAVIWDLLGKGGANLYLCGDAKHMAKDVEKTLIEDVLMAHGGKDAKEAEAFLQNMSRDARYFKDVWSS